MYKYTHSGLRKNGEKRNLSAEFGVKVREFGKNRRVYPEKNEKMQEKATKSAKSEIT